MPDGVFDRSLGVCYMGVRAIFGHRGHGGVLTITDDSVADLLAKGIRLLPDLTADEREAIGQYYGTTFNIYPIFGEAATVYFKVDVSNATPGKHLVEFIVRFPGETKKARHIYVTDCRLDSDGQPTVQVPEGTLKLKLKQILIDREGASNACEPQPSGVGIRPLSTEWPVGPASYAPLVSTLRSRLAGSTDPFATNIGRELEGADSLVPGRQAWAIGTYGSNTTSSSSSTPSEILAAIQLLLSGQPLDQAAYQRLLDLCRCLCDQSSPPGKRCAPYLLLPTKFKYSVTPAVAYAGQLGPLPFQDPWWKLLLLLLHDVSGPGAVALDRSFHDPDLVIGKLDVSRRDDLDVAVCVLNGSREIPSPRLQVLDAQPGEVNEYIVNPPGFGPHIRLESAVNQSGMNLILASPLTSPERRVFKSGARTGVTRGIISGRISSSRPEDGATFSPLFNIQIIPDPDFSASGRISDDGDSGSVWVQTTSKRPVALNHSSGQIQMGVQTGAWYAVASELWKIADDLGVSVTNG